MSISTEELAAWLVDHGLAEFSAGYGHASGEHVAEELLAAFTIEPKVIESEDA